MPAIIRYVAIHADDVERARSFYQTVFGWRFEPSGTLKLYQTTNAGEGLVAALVERREPLSGDGMRGFEVTAGVENLQETIQAILKAGGKLLMPPFHMEGLGELIFFEDTEANRVGAIEYEPGLFG
jgi:predicted enzyme related to lactoylglutathione lyase